MRAASLNANYSDVRTLCIKYASDHVATVCCNDELPFLTSILNKGCPKKPGLGRMEERLGLVNEYYAFAPN